MARRRRSARSGRTPSPRHWRFRLVLAANLLLLMAGGLWYAVQPPSRREEVRILLGNALQRQKRIRPWEVAWDLYTLYYADAFVPCSFAGGTAPVYGGRPRATGIAHSVRILENPGYTVGYCEAWCSPVWVGYRLHDVRGGEESLERPDRFEVDTRTVARVRPEDYAGSGLDRGHLAPSFAIGRCYGAAAQQRTFLMSNTVPQDHGFNAGLWRDLERREALNYTGRFREIWVVTGPLFLGDERRLDAGIRIPDAFYRVQVDEHEGGLRLQAFILRQDAAPGEPLSVFLTTVDEVERLSGLDLFPDLADEVESVLESQAPTRLW